jgi:hypothetical protein
MTSYAGGPMLYIPKESKLTYTKIKLDKKEEKGVEVKVYKFSGGSEEDFLLFLHEFEEAVKSEDMWVEEYITEIYRKFRHVIRGPAASQWEKVLQGRAKKTLANFERQLKELTEVMLYKDPAERQIQYLHETKKPIQLSVQEWIYRIEVINEYLPRMDPDQAKLTDKQIIHRVLAKNIPGLWRDRFYMASGTRCKTLREAAEILQDIEMLERENESKPRRSDHYRKNQNGGHQEQGIRGANQGGNQGRGHNGGRGNNRFGGNQGRGGYQGRGLQNGGGANAGGFRNPCRRHNGIHEWYDCPDNYRNRVREEQTNQGDREIHNLQARVEEDDVSEESFRSDSEESHAVLEKKEKKTTPGAEIVVSVRVQKEGYKYLLGLIDTGSSESLANATAIQVVTDETKPQVEWETQAGKFKTRGVAVLEGIRLPQFTI